MRDILFRGKRLDNGEWAYGYYVHRTWLNGEKCDYIFHDPYEDNCRTTLPVDPETVGQYTGLNDKNGTRIFEGDVVSMPSYGGGKRTTKVYFRDGKFAVDGSNYSYKDIAPKRMEVIGNIYDNPELIGGTE